MADLRYERNAKISGQYGIWWKTKDEPKFSESKTHDLLSKLNEITKGYESYLIGYVLRQTRIVKEVQLKRIKFGDKVANYVLHAPESKKIVMSISRGKGIKFLFPINQVRKEYVERFLKGITVDFWAIRMSLQQQRLPIDEESISYEWYNNLSREIMEREKNMEEIKTIGEINVNIELN